MTNEQQHSDVRPKIIEISNKKGNLTPEELDLWILEGLDEAGYFRPPDQED
jgi:hypothetical protein